MTGLTPSHLAADLSAFVPDRPVDDNAHILLRYDGGARGMHWASQVAVCNENGLRLRVYGDRGGLEWSQEDPNRMTFTRFGQARQILTRGGPGATGAATTATRIPAGHPEGYLAAIATLRRDAADLIAAGIDGGPSRLPGIADGLQGVRFVAACVASVEAGSGWVAFQDASDVPGPGAK